MSTTDPTELTGYEEGLVFNGCEWGKELSKQDACMFCSGAYCCLCLPSPSKPCEHDSFARHFSIPANWVDK